jgi:hypothetical protein
MHDTDIKKCIKPLILDVYAHPLSCFMRLQSIVKGTQVYECFHILE